MGRWSDGWTRGRSQADSLGDLNRRGRCKIGNQYEGGHMARSEGWAAWAHLLKRSGVAGGWVPRSVCSRAWPLPKGGRHAQVGTVRALCPAPSLQQAFEAEALLRFSAGRSCVGELDVSSSAWQQLQDTLDQGVILSKQVVLECDLMLSNEPASVTCPF